MTDFHRWGRSNSSAQYEQYSTPLGAAATGSPVFPASDAPVAAQPVNQGGLSPEAEANVTPRAEVEDPHTIGREEKVEYRDEKGNLLNEAQVAALSGQVSFQTKYETRTRTVDAEGREIGVEGDEARGWSPLPHGEAETGSVAQEDASKSPPKVDASEDLGKERSVAKSKTEAAPGSDASEATA